ncbi:bifunctional 2-polyprenyl-6-hydroxyphenol methylase/3-demethylubiquinol 3-O-methyltransferase UbiG [Afifella sp. IM 167]|uniref:class I SAM-dependent methyltransferase n=1 Tax=Afifella sp. IM 167 TaxID=2033586 RepID=UPI001CCF6846|nr:class I SAM-dependent methyltransferase [Afifella sp. IM 167]
MSEASPDVMNSPNESSAEDFPEDWYAYAGESHFWMRWRFEVLLQQLRSLRVDPAKSLRAFDIGCGHGVVQTQLAGATGWTTDGCELNRPSLDLNRNPRGTSFRYNIHDRRPSLEGAYDAVILFDVIEHIEEPVEFLRSAIWHLKPGGMVLVNVPALQSLFSRYDTEAGHFRRYDKHMLRSQLEAAGLEPADLRYWGLSLVPVLWVRKQVISRAGSAEEVMRLGFRPPSASVNAAFEVLGKAERALFRTPPVGTSLMAAAFKPTEGATAR